MNLFPKALETAAPSDRGVVPLRVPVAPILVRRNYRSAAAAPPRVGSVDWPGGQKSSNALRAIFSSNSDLGWSRNRIGAGHSTLALSRWQRVVRYSRCTFNLGRYLAGWSGRILSSLRKFCQEPRGVLSVLFSPHLSVRFIHATKHGASDVGKIPNSFGVENEFR